MDLKNILGDDLLKQVNEKLGEELVGKVNEEIGKQNYIPHERFNEVNEEKKKLQQQIDKQQEDQEKLIEEKVKPYKEQLEQVNKQLKSLEGKNNENEELKNQLQKAREDSESKITELNEKAEQEKQELQNKLETERFERKLDDALNVHGVRTDEYYRKGLKALLDREKLNIDGDHVLGLKEQLDTIKENAPTYFGETKVQSPEPTPTNPTKNNDSDYFTEEQVDKMSDAEMQKNMEKVLNSQRYWNRR